jgi:hypothetical protein
MTDAGHPRRIIAPSFSPDEPMTSMLAMPRMSSARGASCADRPSLKEATYWLIGEFLQRA